MTKFILHGGATGFDTTKNRKFFREITLGIKKPIVLLVNFAWPKREWPQMVEIQKQQFSNSSKNKKIKLVPASDKIEVLKAQLKKCNIVYIRGGKTEKVQKILKKIVNLEKILKSKKVVAGSSAGANVLAKYSYSNDYDKIRQGLDILPIKTICHYTKYKEPQVQKLKNYKEKLKIIKLKEQEYKIIII